MNGKNTSKLTRMLGLTALMEMTAKALRWFGHLLRIEDNTMTMTLNFEVREKRKKGHPKSKRNGKIKLSLKKIHLNEEVASNCIKWKNCVCTFRNGVISAISVDRGATGLKLEC